MCKYHYMPLWVAQPYFGGGVDYPVDLFLMPLVCHLWRQILNASFCYFVFVFSFDKVIKGCTSRTFPFNLNLMIIIHVGRE